MAREMGARGCFEHEGRVVHGQKEMGETRETPARASFIWGGRNPWRLLFGPRVRKPSIKCHTAAFDVWFPLVGVVFGDTLHVLWSMGLAIEERTEVVETLKMASV